MTKRIEHLSDSVTLYLGDCREILPGLPRVDAVVTDPPYGVNLGNHLGAKDGRADVLVKGNYESYDDTPENYAAVVVPSVRAVLALASRGIVFGVPPAIWLLPAPMAMGGVYLPAACGRNAWGFSSLIHVLLYGHAPDLHLGAKHTAMWSSDVAEKNGHPCPKPLSWMKWALTLASRKGETIIDPFCGSGTTGVAAVKLGRRFIGIEIEPRYFDIACRQIQSALDAPDLFIEQPKPQKQEKMMFDLNVMEKEKRR